MQRGCHGYTISNTHKIPFMDRNLYQMLQLQDAILCPNQNIPLPLPFIKSLSEYGRITFYQNV